MNNNINENQSTGLVPPQIFDFEGHVIRVAGTWENPLFVAADICAALEIKNVSDALASIPENEKGIALIYTLGGPQQMLVLKEPGMYRLLFRSDKPKAEALRSATFSEYLPSIRRTGKYVPGGMADREHLWIAFGQARSGKVQLALLQLLGISIPALIQETPRSLSLNPINPDEFWPDVLHLWEAGRLDRNLFKCKQLEALPDGKWEFVFWPEYVMAALKDHDPKWGRFGRIDFRDGLALMAEWIEGRLTHRLGSEGRRICYKCWGFMTLPNSNAALLKLAAALSAA